MSLCFCHSTWHYILLAYSTDISGLHALCCSQTQQLTEPVKQHLQQLESSIQEQLNQLSILKATVLQNDLHIHRLLTGSNTSAVK
jgi:hypothetical protein